MVDIEAPTEEYYEMLAEDMRKRHPKAAACVLEHCAALEPFLDVSILAGFSFGVQKAVVAVTVGKLLGHVVGRFGKGPDPERIEAIQNFAPLLNDTHIKQFLGSTNWIRQYMIPLYTTCVKILGEYMKEGAVFPEGGLGTADTKGCKAVKCIKHMAKFHIETAVMDEAAAIDGSRPLEQVADASGYAWGGSVFQMSADLERFNVLLMTGKSSRSCSSAR